MKQNSGNVLFIILIAVALFAALSYAVTSSTTNIGSGISKEQASIRASQVIQFGTSLASAVTRLRMNGADETQIYFYNEQCPYLTGYGGSSSPTKFRVFDKEGGGIVCLITPDQDVLKLTNPSPQFAGNIRVTGVGTEKADLIMFLQVSRETCIELDKKLGIALDNGEPFYDPYATWQPFDAYNDTVPGNEFGDDAPAFSGQIEFCRIQDPAPSSPIVYVYQRVLASR